MTLLVAAIGIKALYLLYAWLLSCIIASWLSDQKGYGEKAGLGTGLLLSVVAIPIWLLWPSKENSKWRHRGQRRAARKAAAKPPPPGF